MPAQIVRSGVTVDLSEIDIIFVFYILGNILNSTKCMNPEGNHLALQRIWYHNAY